MWLSAQPQRMESNPPAVSGEHIYPPCAAPDPDRIPNRRSPAGLLRLIFSNRSFPSLFSPSSQAERRSKICPVSRFQSEQPYNCPQELLKSAYRGVYPLLLIEKMKRLTRWVEKPYNLGCSNTHPFDDLDAVFDKMDCRGYEQLIRREPASDLQEI